MGGGWAAGPTGGWEDGESKKKKQHRSSQTAGYGIKDIMSNKSEELKVWLHYKTHVNKKKNKRTRRICFHYFGLSTHVLCTIPSSTVD